MLTEIEFSQLRVAISHMHSPISVGSRETCYKNHVLELLDNYTEEKEVLKQLD